MEASWSGQDGWAGVPHHHQWGSDPLSHKVLMPDQASFFSFPPFNGNSFLWAISDSMKNRCSLYRIQTVQADKKKKIKVTLNPVTPVTPTRTWCLGLRASRVQGTCTIHMSGLLLCTGVLPPPCPYIASCARLPMSTASLVSDFSP